MIKTHTGFSAATWSAVVLVSASLAVRPAYADGSGSTSFGGSSGICSDEALASITGSTQTQKKSYCYAARSADMAGDTAGTLEMIWAGVAAVCTVACALEFTAWAGGNIQLVCKGISLAGSAYDLLKGSQLSSDMAALRNKQLTGRLMHGPELDRSYKNGFALSHENFEKMALGLPMPAEFNDMYSPSDRKHSVKEIIDVLSDFGKLQKSIAARRHELASTDLVRPSFLSTKAQTGGMLNQISRQGGTMVAGLFTGLPAFQVNGGTNINNGTASGTMGKLDSCGSAAMAILQTYVKSSTVSDSKQTSNTNLQMAAKLETQLTSASFQSAMTPTSNANTNTGSGSGTTNGNGSSSTNTNSGSSSNTGTAGSSTSSNTNTNTNTTSNTMTASNSSVSSGTTVSSNTPANAVGKSTSDGLSTASPNNTSAVPLSAGSTSSTSSTVNNGYSATGAQLAATAGETCRGSSGQAIVSCAVHVDPQLPRAVASQAFLDGFKSMSGMDFGTFVTTGKSSGASPGRAIDVATRNVLKPGTAQALATALSNFEASSTLAQAKALYAGGGTVVAQNTPMGSPAGNLGANGSMSGATMIDAQGGLGLGKQARAMPGAGTTGNGLQNGHLPNGQITGLEGLPKNQAAALAQGRTLASNQVPTAVDKSFSEYDQSLSLFTRVSHVVQNKAQRGQLGRFGLPPRGTVLPGWQSSRQ